VTQPREIALYVRAFAELAKAARYGPEARELVRSELAALRTDVRG
jgi:hypothetical protein